MKHLEQLLQEHYVNFPHMELQDAVKFLYQHHMGPGHLVVDEAAAYARLSEEWACVKTSSDVPLYHSLGNGLCRLHLSSCKAIGLSHKTVARLFCLTAQRFVPDPEGLSQSLSLVRRLPFPPQETERYLSQYLAQGCPMVSHSPGFRQHYSPAYRIVSEHYVNILPVLSAIDRAMEDQPRLRVAIDGPCASGKSTLGAVLAEVYRCPLIHMDDFFLRPEQRTPQRLAQPGGNVDHERFMKEVLSPLLAGEPVRYRPWDCGSGSFAPEVRLEPSALTVVEGCYSLRHDLRQSYQLRIWVHAHWESRRKRLLDRGGPQCLSRFEQLWIPQENRYFEECGVADCCHVHLDLS